MNNTIIELGFHGIKQNTAVVRGKKPLNINCPLIYSIRQKVYHSPSTSEQHHLAKIGPKKKKHFSTTMHHYNKRLT